MIDLRCGAYQDVMQDVTCDALICDPPYSARTHAGALDATTLTVGVTGYAAMDESAAAAFVTSWAPRCRGWMVVHTDDQLFPFFRAAMEAAGRYTFPMLPVLQQQPRVSGDGPPSAGHLLCVSRPRSKAFLSWGSLPGWYECRRDGSIVRGGKPLDLMRAIVRDYSRPGDIVCDPTSGGATTLIAAHVEGRKAIGCEMDPKTHALAMNRIATSGEIEKFAPLDVLKHAKQARLF